MVIETHWYSHKMVPMVI